MSNLKTLSITLLASALALTACSEEGSKKVSDDDNVTKITEKPTDTKKAEVEGTVEQDTSTTKAKPTSEDNTAVSTDDSEDSAKKINESLAKSNDGMIAEIVDVT